MQSTAQSSSEPRASQRAELSQVLNNYLSALAGRDHGPVRVANGARITENAEDIAFGEGLYRSALRIRPETRVDFIDPVSGQAGSQFVAEERGGVPTIAQVRLKLVSGEITELETIAVRDGDLKFFEPAGMVPVSIFRERVAPERRTSRERMVDTVERYVELLRNGSFTASKTRLHKDMVRWENGAVTSDYAQLAARENGPKRSAIPTRIPIIDEEYGLVYALLEFGTAERTLCPFELFKIENDEIMMLHIVIKPMRSGVWGRAG